MPNTLNNSTAPRQPDTTRKATATSSTTTAPGPRHVRIHRGEAARGAGTERIIGRAPGPSVS